MLALGPCAYLIHKCGPFCRDGALLYKRVPCNTHVCFLLRFPIDVPALLGFGTCANILQTGTLSRSRFARAVIAGLPLSLPPYTRPARKRSEWQSLCDRRSGACPNVILVRARKKVHPGAEGFAFHLQRPHELLKTCFLSCVIPVAS